MKRLLYILPGLVPPGLAPGRDKFQHLSEICEGDILLPVWWSSVKDVAPHLKGTFPEYRVGRFTYHLFLFLKAPRLARKIVTFLWYVRRGRQLHRKNKIDVIVSYGTNLPGIAGLILKWLTGAKLIVEVPGVPENAFRYDAPKPGKGFLVRRMLSDKLLYLVGTASVCFKLLYPWQLQKYPKLQKKPAAIFHDFVPLHSVPSVETPEKFILSVGHPWYTKGIDILIQAFKKISAEFPDYKLKLMGYFPDRQTLEILVADCSQIEFLAPAPNEQALNVIAACSVFVLASRTEAMGRVLLEAMAACKPIIASNVGGVRHYITDNVNGLLFESERIDELASKLALVLNDRELQIRLARNGHEMAFSQLDELSYVQAFNHMLDLLC
jgi:glycosyltransferase involved in cell wall biosynthesis